MFEGVTLATNYGRTVHDVGETFEEMTIYLQEQGITYIYIRGGMMFATTSSSNLKHSGRTHCANDHCAGEFLGCGH